MRFFTCRELTETRVPGMPEERTGINCDTVRLAAGNVDWDAPIPYGILANNLLFSGNYEEGDAWRIFWRNHVFLCPVTPDSVGQEIFDKCMDYMRIKNCGQHLYRVKDIEDCDRISIGHALKNCYWCFDVHACNHVLLSQTLLKESYIVCNKRVTPERFEEIKLALLETESVREFIQTLPEATDKTKVLQLIDEIEHPPFI